MVADCYNLLCFYNAAKPKESFPKAETAALKALELDENMAEAHAAWLWCADRGRSARTGQQAHITALAVEIKVLPLSRLTLYRGYRSALSTRFAPERHGSPVCRLIDRRRCHAPPDEP